MENKIIVLTKTNCSNCTKLKLYLENTVDEDKQDNIRYILQDDEPELFTEYAEKYNVASLPTVIHNDVSFINPNASFIQSLVMREA